MRNTQIAIRLDDGQLAMLDEKIEQLRVDVPGVTWNRAAAIKYLAMMMAKPVKLEAATIWTAGAIPGTSVTVPRTHDQVTYT